MNIGLRKEFGNNGGTINLSFSDIFRTNITVFETDLPEQYLNETTSYDYYKPLPLEVANKWITPYDKQLWEKGQKKALQELIKPFKDELDAHMVARLRGKEYVGNVPGISEEVEYAELVF